MATIQVVTGATTVTHTTTTKVSYIDDTNQNLPQGLNPLRLMLYTVPEYRILNGWPVSAPRYDVSGKTLVDATGDTLADRPDPFSVSTMASARWIADDTYYDPSELVWRPFQSRLDLAWSTSTDYAPTLLDAYSYSVGKEVFYRNALNFDAEASQHMWLGPNNLQMNGYTMVMVLSLSSFYGSNTAPYKGLWCFGEPTPAAGQPISETPDGGWVNLTQVGNRLWVETDQSKNTAGVAVGDVVAQTRPVYLAMVVSRPSVSVYVATGPSSIRSTTVPIGTEQVRMDPDIVLGRSTGDVLHSMDMSLFDLGFYTEALNAEQIQAEISTLSQVYGG